MNRRFGAAVVLAVLGLLAACGDDRDGPQYPDREGRSIVDDADVVPDDTEQEVAAQIDSFQERVGPRIAVAVVDTTEPQSIEDYSEDLFDRWKIGDEKRDDGVLLVLAIEDRKARVEVGFGVEGDLTDVESREVIDAMRPLLQEENYGGALLLATGIMRHQLGDEEVGALPATPREEPAEEDSWWGLVPVVLFGLFMAGGGIMARRRRGGRRGGDWFTPIIFGGGWGGGGFSGGGGGGGFSAGGFGGGGSGGGGASGGW